MLMICGMYQMFGHYFKTQENVKIPGIGILDIYTIGEKGRLIGNVCSETKWGQIAGYENHSGRTYLSGSKEFGKTEPKQGNNGKDKSEGAMSNNVIGTYMHGPILAKAPNFADYLISLSIVSSGQSIGLEPIDDRLEQLASKVAKTRPR
jgi:CobQ-like glutamine amidotransferase family enzyme